MMHGPSISYTMLLVYHCDIRKCEQFIVLILFYIVTFTTIEVTIILAI